MRLPGFTAGSSVYRLAENYEMVSRALSGNLSRAIVPSRIRKIIPKCFPKCPTAPRAILAADRVSADPLQYAILEVASVYALYQTNFGA